jgi:four helix bundle protein
VRAGTAAGALYEEGRGAESRADFIHKLAMTWKEVRETWYWLRLIQRAELVRPARLNGLIEEASQLSAILSSSLKTARSRRTDQ